MVGNGQWISIIETKRIDIANFHAFIKIIPKTFNIFIIHLGTDIQ